MKNRDANRHPGIMRVMKVDSEFAGILVAVGFLVMGAVGLDIGRWFVVGGLGLGVAVAFSSGSRGRATDLGIPTEINSRSFAPLRCNENKKGVPPRVEYVLEAQALKEARR